MTTPPTRPTLADTVDPAPALNWPEHWTSEAVDAVETTLELLAELEGPAWSALLSAGELLTTAGRLEDKARAADWTAIGSAGQEILHPAVPEARQCRAAANAVLLRLIPPATEGTRSHAGRTMARQRWAIR